MTQFNIPLTQTTSIPWRSLLELSTPVARLLRSPSLLAMGHLQLEWRLRRIFRWSRRIVMVTGRREVTDWTLWYGNLMEPIWNQRLRMKVYSIAYHRKPSHTQPESKKTQFATSLLTSRSCHRFVTTTDIRMHSHGLQRTDSRAYGFATTSWSLLQDLDVIHRLVASCFSKL